MEILIILLMLLLFIVRELKRPPVVEKQVIETVRENVKVEKPSFLLENDILDLDELLVYVATQMQNSGAVSKNVKFAKSWHSFVSKHIDPKYPVTLWPAPNPALWIGTNIPGVLLEYLQSAEAEHAADVQNILSQEG